MRVGLNILIFWIVVVIAAQIAWRLADPAYLFAIAIPIGLCMLGAVKVIRMAAARLIKRFKTD